MIKTVLFLTEKWCDGNPDMGLTNHYHNLFSALESTGLVGNIQTRHFDEIRYNTGQHIDTFADQILDETTPDVVVVSHWGRQDVNPTPITYNKIKSRGIKLVFTWPDTREWIPDVIRDLNMADLHVSWACEGDDRYPLCPNHIWLWTPEDPRLYFDDVKTTDVTFVGSTNGYRGVRTYCLNYLNMNGVPVVVSGGQREHKLSAEDYAKMVRTAKINLNFSESAYPGIHQCKGRVFEALASNSLLLEDANIATRRKIVPGTHYIEFFSEVDLKDKVQYFLKNEDERKAIAKCGHDYYNTTYTAIHYWNIVFDRIS